MAYCRFFTKLNQIERKKERERGSEEVMGSHSLYVSPYIPILSLLPPPSFFSVLHALVHHILYKPANPQFQMM